jgi:hypothetical protein
MASGRVPKTIMTLKDIDPSWDMATPECYCRKRVLLPRNKEKQPDGNLSNPVEDGCVTDDLE